MAQELVKPAIPCGHEEVQDGIRHPVVAQPGVNHLPVEVARHGPGEGGGVPRQEGVKAGLRIGLEAAAVVIQG